jgi:predicted metalloprotease with PDZ domain
LYINPVNCFYYNPKDINSEFEIQFQLPADYVIATGMKKANPHTLIARSFDELADCPLIASNSLKHLDYSVSGVKYNIWIQGEVKLEEARLVNEFAAFTKSQIKIFGDIPCEEYHFLFHFAPFFVRHGVEHSNSTVIAMGPAADFQLDALFKDLLGISCHELFHTWNVKNIRPLEMMPYDFTTENYSRLGYVYEGVTTYYGDLLLWRSGAINFAEWAQIMEERLQDYFDNYGRQNLSVAESSFDTWLDGYGPGIPWRKVSIYNEGFLLALICDLLAINFSKGEKSLDSVMKIMYDDFGKKNRGYTEKDYKDLLSDCIPQNVVNGVFDSLVNGTVEYSSMLNQALGAVGLQIVEIPSGKWAEASLGLFVDEGNMKVVVAGVMPDSPADRSGLWNGDEIISVNDTLPYKNFQAMLRMFEGPVYLEVLRKGKRKKICLSADGLIWGKKYRLQKVEGTSESIASNFDKWQFG